METGDVTEARRAVAFIGYTQVFPNELPLYHPAVPSTAYHQKQRGKRGHTDAIESSASAIHQEGFWMLTI